MYGDAFVKSLPTREPLLKKLDSSLGAWDDLAVRRMDAGLEEEGRSVLVSRWKRDIVGFRSVHRFGEMPGRVGYSSTVWAPREHVLLGSPGRARSRKRVVA